MAEKSNDILVRVEDVSKKFCKSLKKSLWYGLGDIFSEVIGSSKSDHLRSDEFWAVNDISFELRRGECLGLIGHNGAGKSTLLKMLNGLIKPDKGRIEMTGRVGALIELGSGFNPILTGRENIYNNAAVLGFSKKEVDSKMRQIIEFSEIEEFLDTPVQNYSSGMKVRLGFAVAAQLEPDILIIDEVLAVGDIGFRIKCLNAIGNLLNNTAVIFVSHSMPQIARICTRTLLLGKGQCLIDSTDISYTISEYYKVFDSEKSTSVGSGLATIQNVKVDNLHLAPESQEDPTVENGKELKLIIETSIDQSISSYIIKVMFVNSEMRTVLDIASEINNEPFNNTGLNEITLTIPKLNLNTGSYGITIVIQEGSSKERLLRHDNVTFITVKSSYISWSDSTMAGDWNTK